MSYVPNTWAVGNPVPKGKLDHMEAGIAAAFSEAIRARIVFLGGDLRDFVESGANTWTDLPNGLVVPLPADLPTGFGYFLDFTGLQQAAGSVTLECRLWDIDASAPVTASVAAAANPGTSPIRGVSASHFTTVGGHLYRPQIRRTTTNARVAALVRVYVDEV